MTRIFQFLTGTILFFLVISYCAPAKAMQVPERHGPPWAGAVSASTTVHLGTSTIQIDFGPGGLDLKQEDIAQWIETAGRAITMYFGRFPVARARILVVPVAGQHGVLTGTTWGRVGGFPAFSRMRLGEHTTKQELEDDWTMTHELVHVSFPSLPDNNHWLEEGLATYVEPIARVQIGTLTKEQIWGDMYRDMRKGEPGVSGKGLNQTHTWASTYWGGALFCLMADVSIRQKTAGRKGLQDALRGIVNAGGTIDQDWPVAKVLAVGDNATGTSVLTTLFKTMGEEPGFVDLENLWNRLGVSIDNGQLVLDTRAPLAQVREQITSQHVPRP